MNLNDTSRLNLKNDCNLIFSGTKRSSRISFKYTSVGEAFTGKIETSKIQAKIS